MSSAMQAAPEQPLWSAEQASTAERTSGHVCGIVQMIAKSQEAFRRDLPELLKNRYGQWVAYHGDERIGFGRTQLELYRECLRRGLKGEVPPPLNCEIPPMIAQSQAAFRRDLPQLLKERPWQWVAYHGQERIGFAKSNTELYQRCLARGLDWDQFVVRSIEPEELPHETDVFLDV